MDIILHANQFDEMVYNVLKINCHSLGLRKSIKDIQNLKDETKRKYLFFLNPIGGSGKSLQIWNSIQPILSN